VPNYQMDVIPEPEEGTASVLVLAHEGPHALIQGSGTTNYLCGVCDNVICRGVDRGGVAHLVFKCPNCGSYNRVRGT